MNSPLILKSKQFALDIIKICNLIKSEKRESVLTNQLVRSGTSMTIGTFPICHVFSALYHGKYFYSKNLTYFC